MWDVTLIFLEKLSIDVMVGFLGMLVALLVPIAILIFEQSGRDETGDFFPWEKSVLIKYIAKAPIMFGAICVASLSLALWTIDNGILRAILLILYLASCAVISIRLFCLYRWFSAIAKINNRETYRQTVKFKFLKKLKTDENRLNIWASTWSNIKPTNPHQVKYLKIYLKTISQISEDVNSWSFISTLTQNLDKVNVHHPEIQKLIINNTLGAYKQRADHVHIDRFKDTLFESLVEKLLADGDEWSGMPRALHLIDDFLNKEYEKNKNQAGTILNSFIRILLSKLDFLSKNPDDTRKTLGYIPPEWRFNSLLNDNKGKDEKADRQRSKAYAVLCAYYEWFCEKYTSRHNSRKDKDEVDKQINAVSRGILGISYHRVISEKMFGDLLSFYGNTMWGSSDKDETIEHAFVRLFIDDSRWFMMCDSYSSISNYDPTESEEDRNKRMFETISDQKVIKNDNTITLLRYVLRYINNTKHVNDVLNVIKKYSDEITGDDQEKKYKQAKLDELEATFKLIKKTFLKNNKKEVR